MPAVGHHRMLRGEQGGASIKAQQQRWEDGSSYVSGRLCCESRAAGAPYAPPVPPYRQLRSRLHPGRAPTPPRTWRLRAARRSPQPPRRALTPPRRASSWPLTTAATPAPSEARPTARPRRPTGLGGTPATPPATAAGGASERRRSRAAARRPRAGRVRRRPPSQARSRRCLQLVLVPSQWRRQAPPARGRPASALGVSAQQAPHSRRVHLQLGLAQETSLAIPFLLPTLSFAFAPFALFAPAFCFCIDRCMQASRFCRNPAAAASPDARGH